MDGGGTIRSKDKTLVTPGLDAARIREGLTRLGLERLYNEPFNNARDFASRFRRCSILRESDTSYSANIGH